MQSDQHAERWRIALTCAFEQFTVARLAHFPVLDPQPWRCQWAITSGFDGINCEAFRAQFHYCQTVRSALYEASRAPNKRTGFFARGQTSRGRGAGNLLPRSWV